MQSNVIIYIHLTEQQLTLWNPSIANFVEVGNWFGSSQSFHHSWTSYRVTYILQSHIHIRIRDGNNMELPIDVIPGVPYTPMQLPIQYFNFLIWYFGHRRLSFYSTDTVDISSDISTYRYSESCSFMVHCGNIENIFLFIKLSS